MAWWGCWSQQAFQPLALETASAVAAYTLGVVVADTPACMAAVEVDTFEVVAVKHIAEQSERSN